MRRRAPICLLLALATTVWAARPAGAEPSPSGESACAAAAHRQFDFRLGRFKVTTVDGIEAGSSRVEAILGGCALVEHWQGAVSGDGQAWSFFDRGTGRWHMTFVHSEGHVLRLSGTFVDGTLVLEGENFTFDGVFGLHRMSWSPLPADGVRQLWELSTSGGADWQVLFEGRYARLP